jgi:threonine/homoserine/homoserine lactone efflux protein
MSLYGLSIFAAVYVLAVASPGPGVAAIVARVLGRGTRGAPAFIAGFLVGDLIWFTFAATGRARKHLTRPQSVRWVQRGTGVVMAGAAVAVATR